MTIEQANMYLDLLKATLATARKECSTAFVLDLALLIEKTEKEIQEIQGN